MLLIILFIDKDEKARKEWRKEGEREGMKKRKNLSKRSTNPGKKKMPGLGLRQWTYTCLFPSKGMNGGEVYQIDQLQMWS